MQRQLQRPQSPAAIDGGSREEETHGRARHAAAGALQLCPRTCSRATPARGGKTAYIDDPARSPTPNSTRACGRPPRRCIALGLRREERVLLCLHDTVDFPVAFLGALYAGIVPVAVNTLLTARRLRVHARAQPRAGAVRVRRAAADAGAGAGARRARRRARHRVAVPRSGALAARRARFRRHGCDRGTAAAGARGHRRRRHGVLALFVRLDRPPKGTVHTHANLLLDRANSTARRCSASARTTSCSRRRSCSSPTASATR